MHIQPNICTNKAFSCTSTRLNPYTLAGVVTYMFHTSQSTGINLVDVLHLHMCLAACMCMFELTVTGWWIIVTQLSIPNQFELHS